MFELPAVLPQDHDQDATQVAVKAYFRNLEEKEVHDLISRKRTSDGDQSVTPRYVEVVQRQLHLKGLDTVEEYVGLVSQGVFDANGRLIGDLFSETQASLGRRKNAKELPVRDIRLDEPTTNPLAKDASSRIATSSISRSIIALQAGIDLLPRSTCRPQVWMDNAVTQSFVHDAQSKNTRGLSDKAKKILMRSNYRAPFGLSYNKAQDHWSAHSFIRRRSLQVLTNVLYLCLERREYEQAWFALCCLLRSKFVDVRLIWMPALELLAWRHLEYPGTRSVDDFFEWLIVNFPSSPQSRDSSHRKRPKSAELVPFAILSKLASRQYEAALAQAENVVNSAPYNSDPMCWALCGLASLKLQRKDDSSRSARTKRYFTRCIELGGVVTSRTWCQAFNSRDSDAESDDDAENTSGGDDMHLHVVNLSSHKNSHNEDSYDSDGRHSLASSRIDSEALETPTTIGNYHVEGLELSSQRGGESSTDAEDEPRDTPAQKRQKLTLKEETQDASEDASSDSASTDERENDDRYEGDGDIKHEQTSSQPFYSQAQSLGAEMGSSDSDDDLL